MSRYRGGPTTTLYIRNISDRVRYDDLRRLFQKYGKLVDVTIPLDYFSGLPKGFCFVEYEDPRDAEEAQYRMDRQRLFGREIEVEFARGDRKTPGEMRTRDRESVRYPRGGPYDRRMDQYERFERRSRTRSRSRSPIRERRHAERRVRTKSREPSYERSKSRASRSYSKNRTPSPRRQKSESRERSRTRERSVSRPRGSPRRHETRSPKVNENMSRSPSPA